MIELRPFAGLGGGNHGWLDTKHHFSFGDYQDPARVNWGNIRVWNDDVIAPAQRLSHPSAPRHGDHHLRPRRCDHASG